MEKEAKNPISNFIDDLGIKTCYIDFPNNWDKWRDNWRGPKQFPENETYNWYTTFSPQTTSKTIDNESSWGFQVACPGVKKEDIKVTIDKRRVTVTLPNEYFINQTVHYFYPGDTVDLLGEVNTNYENGVLTVTFNKEVIEEDTITIKIK